MRIVWKVMAVASALLLCAQIVIAQSQLGSPLSWVSETAQPGQFYLVQKTPGDQLLLTPNESFFPRPGLKAEGQGDAVDLDNLNGGKSFASIVDWNNAAEAEWGIWLAEANTTVQVTFHASDANAFAVSIDGQQADTKNGQPVFFLKEAGRHSVVVRCTKASSNPRLHSLKIEGVPAGSGVIRKRWRPAAAHTKFHSSQNPQQVRMWIMEMDAVPGDLGFYSPITTPFGYYGPTWQADGTVNSGFNFSLWSYSQNAPEPPLNEHSHLIAVGSPDAAFGSFGHEGTGVKIRDWEPLAGQQGQRQAFALRVEPGDEYDTYFSYFYSSKEQQWKFFGAGKKYNKNKPLDSLWVGSFVEVPGPPQVQRTGVYPRRMNYRGWVVDARGKLFTLDSMSNGNVDRKSGYTHTNRGIADNGWFFLETGGWTFRMPPNDGADVVMTVDDSAATPPYLTTSNLEQLQSVPCEIAISRIKRNGEDMTVEFNLRTDGVPSEVMVYWGAKDCLTFSESWQFSRKVGKLLAGHHQITLPSVDSVLPVFVRLIARNSAGQYWSVETVEASKP